MSFRKSSVRGRKSGDPPREPTLTDPQESDFRLRLAEEAERFCWLEYRPLTGEFFMDRRARALWGLKPESHGDLNAFWAGIHPGDMPHVRAAIESVLNPIQLDRLEIECRVRPSDGSPERWVLLTGEPVFEEDGEGSPAA